MCYTARVPDLSKHLESTRTRHRNSITYTLREDLLLSLYLISVHTCQELYDPAAQLWYVPTEETKVKQKRSRQESALFDGFGFGFEKVMGYHQWEEITRRHVFVAHLSGGNSSKTLSVFRGSLFRRLYVCLFEEVIFGYFRGDGWTPVQKFNSSMTSQ